MNCFCSSSLTWNLTNARVYVRFRVSEKSDRDSAENRPYLSQRFSVPTSWAIALGVDVRVNQRSRR